MIGMANITAEEQTVKLCINNTKGKTAEVYTVDEKSNYDVSAKVEVTSEIQITLPEYSFISIVLK